MSGVGGGGVLLHRPAVLLLCGGCAHAKLTTTKSNWHHGSRK